MTPEDLAADDEISPEEDDGIEVIPCKVDPVPEWRRFDPLNYDIKDEEACRLFLLTQEAGFSHSGTLKRDPVDELAHLRHVALESLSTLKDAEATGAETDLGRLQEALRRIAAEDVAAFCQHAVLSGREDAITPFGQALDKLKPQSPLEELNYRFLAGRYLLWHLIQHGKYPENTSELREGLGIGKEDLSDSNLRKCLAFYGLDAEIQDKRGPKPKT